MGKQWSMLVLALMLVLSGCAGQATLVRDALVNTMEKPNYDYQGSIKLTGEPEKFLQLMGEEDGAEAAAVIDALKAGLTISGSQLDLEKAKMTLQVNDDQLLREHGLWNGADKAALEMLVNGTDVLVKTPLDENYLSLDNGLESGGLDPALSPEKAKAFQEKMNKLVLDFTKKYIASYGFHFSQVKNNGQTTVTLPDGTKTDATHISIALDVEELVKLFFYTADNATTNPDVKQFAIDMLVLVSELEEETNPDLPRSTPEARRAKAEAMVTMGLASLRQWLDTEAKTYTPEQLAAELKKEGLEGLNWTIDFYIDKNKMPVRQASKLSVTVKDDARPELGSVTIGFDADSYYWNFGKATSFDLPNEAQIVTLAELQAGEKSVDRFHEDSFLRVFLETMLAEEELELIQ